MKSVFWTNFLIRGDNKYIKLAIDISFQELTKDNLTSIGSSFLYSQIISIKEKKKDYAVFKTRRCTILHST